MISVAAVGALVPQEFSAATPALGAGRVDDARAAYEAARTSGTAVQ